MNLVRRVWWWLCDIPRRVKVALCKHEFVAVDRPQIHAGITTSQECADDLLFALAAFRGFRDSSGEPAWSNSGQTQAPKYVPIRCHKCKHVEMLETISP